MLSSPVPLIVGECDRIACSNSLADLLEDAVICCCSLQRQLQTPRANHRLCPSVWFGDHCGSGAHRCQFQHRVHDSVVTTTGGCLAGGCTKSAIASRAASELGQLCYQHWTCCCCGLQTSYSAPREWYLLVLNLSVSRDDPTPHSSRWRNA